MNPLLHNFQKEKNEEYWWIWIWIWIWIAADTGGCHGDCVSDAAGCQVCDYVIVISPGVWLITISFSYFLIFFFFFFLKFSIVPKPRLMQWIRLPWLPFGMDLPIKEPLVGILPIVFVVFQLEKSLSCKEPPPVLLPISSFSHSQFLSLISLLFWHHHFNCLSGWKGFAESGTGWDNFHWDWDAHIFDLSVSEFCLLSSFWGRCFCQFTLWASVCCRYFDVNSLSGTIPTEIGMLTSLTNLWVNSASCHLFEGRCFWCNWLCGLLFAVGIWIRTSWAEPFPLRFGCSQLWPYCEWILPLVTFSGGISAAIYSGGLLAFFFSGRNLDGIPLCYNVNYQTWAETNDYALVTFCAAASCPELYGPSCSSPCLCANTPCFSGASGNGSCLTRMPF